MSRRKSYNIPGHAHFLTFSCWERRPFLVDEVVCKSFVQTLDEARRLEQFAIWAYVLMPEHVHLLILPQNPTYEMPRILRRIKEPAARQVLQCWRDSHSLQLEQAIDTTGGPIVHRFWQPGGGFDRNLWDQDAIRKAIEYIEWNPVRRGLVRDPTDWEWSSARARAGHGSVPLEIDPVNLEINVSRES